MPFKSKAQMKWMYANHPKMAEKWAKETPDIHHLPQKHDQKKRTKVEEAAKELFK